MNNGIIILLASVLGVFIIAIIILISSSLKKSKKEEITKNVTKNRDAVLKDANKRLASNPKDVKALLSIADLYYTEGDYPKAMKAYHVLLDLCGLDPEIDETEINLRYGLSAMQCKAYNEAYKGLVIAKGKTPDLFEINSNLGILEYKKRSYEKCVFHLQRALKQKPDHKESQKYMGLGMFRLKKFSEAISYLKMASSNSPDDKEAVFALACSHYEVGQMEMAQKIFTHLRPDPDWGPQSALYSGTINIKKKDFEKAIMDFEIGLKHENIPTTLKLDILYRLGNAYIQEGSLSHGLTTYRKILEMVPDYKDVKKQVSKFTELSQNQNFQTYLLSPMSEFITICRKLTTVIFPNTKIKVSDISVQKGEYVDLLAEIKTKKWEDVVLFRFTRTEGQIGELFIRDLYARSKEVHAGRGFCLAPGSFSKEARTFVEARLIDLIEKKDLLDKLNQIRLF